MEITMIYLLVGIVMGFIAGGTAGYLTGAVHEQIDGYNRQLKKIADEVEQDLLKAQIKQEILEELKSEKP